MKSTKYALLSVLAGFLVLFATEARATVPTNILSATLTVYTQTEIVTNNSIEQAKLNKFRVTTKDLLAILEGLVGQNFPNGSQILVDDSGNTYVADKSGAIIQSVTDYLSFSFGYSDGLSVWNGKYNLDTAQENSKIEFMLHVEIGTGTNQSVSLQGLAFETFKAGAVDNNGQQKLNGIINAKVAGDGYANGEYNLIEGKVSLKGKGVFDSGL